MTPPHPSLVGPRALGSVLSIRGWAPQAKEERLAEEKAKKKAAAKKMEEVEARRKQEEEARRLRWLQQVRSIAGLRRRGRGGEGPRCLRALGTAEHTLHPVGLIRVDLVASSSEGCGGGDGDT